MRSQTSDAKIPDVVGGAVIAIVGAGFTFGGVEYGLRGSEGQLDPGAMPFFAGTLLLVFGVAIALLALRPRPSHSAPEPPSSATPEPAATVESATAATNDPAQASDAPTDTSEPARAGDSLVRVFSLVALAAVAITAITWFDTYITLGVLVVVILNAFERVPVWKSVAVALGVMGACYLIFAVLLNVPLPSVF